MGHIKSLKSTFEAFTLLTFLSHFSQNMEILSVMIELINKQVGEVGELSEIFQWKGEVAKGLPDWKEEEKVHLGEELSDVLLYLIRLSDMCGVDLGKAALRKVELNAIKYPAPSDKNNNATNDSV